MKKVKKRLIYWMKVFAFIICISLLGLLLVSCKGEIEADTNGKPVVYTSFYPIYNLAQELVGDDIEIRSFMPVDKSPHLWEPSPRDISRLNEADFLIVNGANMERWLDDVKTALPDLEVLTLSDSVELITYKGAAAMGDFQFMASYPYAKSASIEFGHTHEDLMRVAFYLNKDNKSQEQLIEVGKSIMEKQAPLIAQDTTIEVESGEVYGLEMGHESGYIGLEFPQEGEWIFFSDRVSEPLLPYLITDLDQNEIEPKILLEGSSSGMDKVSYDPHSWLSPKNTKKYLNAMVIEFSERYPELGRKMQRKKVKMVDELTRMEADYKEKFKHLDKRAFIVSHNAYAYLARDFELRQFALQGLISTDSPSLKTIRKAIDTSRYYGLNTIFYEYGCEKKGADTVASEIGGRTLPLASMEYLTPEQRREGVSYIDLMRRNLDYLYESLADAKVESNR